MRKEKYARVCMWRWGFSETLAVLGETKRERWTPRTWWPTSTPSPKRPSSPWPPPWSSFRSVTGLFFFSRFCEWFVGRICLLCTFSGTCDVLLIWSFVYLSDWSVALFRRMQVYLFFKKKLKFYCVCYVYLSKFILSMYNWLGGFFYLSPNGICYSIAIEVHRDFFLFYFFKCGQALLVPRDFAYATCYCPICGMPHFVIAGSITWFCWQSS